jgi:hypothetical protein
VRIKAVLIFAVVLGAVATISYGITILASDGVSGTKAQSPGPSRDELDRAKAELERDIEEDLKKPNFLGKVGAFEVIERDADTLLEELCSSGEIRGVRGESQLLPSELNRPETAQQIVCEDGPVVATFSQDTGRISYFRTAPQISVTASIDRLEYLEVDGHPVLIVKPAGGVGIYEVFVVLRPSSNDESGILVSTLGGDSLEKATAVARQALSR